MNEHPSLETATSGSIRFNTDSRRLEIYNGEQWFEIDATSPDEQTGGTIGMILGGFLYRKWHEIDARTLPKTGPKLLPQKR